MLKFLSLSDVVSVLADEGADAYLKMAREESKPIDHKDKSDAELLGDLK